MIAKRYKEIREGIHTIVVETLFDPLALKEHFSGRKKYIQEMLHLGRLSKPEYTSNITFYPLEHHFGSLLNSEAANRIIERKINLALARPEGMVEICTGSVITVVSHNGCFHVHCTFAQVSS